MKKLLLFVLLIGFYSAQGQEDQIFGNDKSGNNSGNQTTSSQMANDFILARGNFTALEVSFNPGNIFGSNTGNMFGLINGYIKYRHFSDRTHAFRMGVNVLYLSQKSIIQQADSEAGLEELSANVNSKGLSLMLGSERHFNINNRLSPYTGWQVELGYLTSKYIEEYQDGSAVESYIYRNYNLPAGVPTGKIALGFGFVTGIDYYFLKNFYFGIEIGVGLEYSKYLDGSFEDTGDSSAGEDFHQGYQILLSPGLTTGNLRLGWSF